MDVDDDGRVRAGAGAVSAAPLTELDRKVSRLVKKILSRDCVLVLGPRVAAPPEVSAAELPIDNHVASRLLEDLGEDSSEPTELRRAIARYEKAKSPSACRTMIQDIVSELDPYSTDLHRQLALLPFRLVLLATPDRMMARAYETMDPANGVKQAQQACYDYCRGVAADLDLTAPTVESPIVYSLLGRHDQPSSMVLNDRNLLDYLVKIVKENPALPDRVRATLRAPSTVFLFVGFGFTNWWLRLLLKVLEVTGVENRVDSLALEDACNFTAAASQEHKGFFESEGIYIQAGDWNSLARDLVAKVREQDTAAGSGTRAPANLPPMSGGAPVGRPLVFLSYASEDVDRVDLMRAELQKRGVFVWQDRQNLRAGQNWDLQIARVIKDCDYFVFVQTDSTDARDLALKDGVYNRELKRAIQRVDDKPMGTVFLLHVTIGSCRERPEPELGKVNRIAVDPASGRGCDKLAAEILEAYAGARAGMAAAGVAGPA